MSMRIKVNLIIGWFFGNPKKLQNGNNECNDETKYQDHKDATDISHAELAS